MRANVSHWFPCRTSEAAHFSIKSDGKARLAAERAEILVCVRWAAGSLDWTSIGTTLGGGVTTFVGGVTILGVVAILGFRSVKLGLVCLTRTSRVDQVGAL